MGPLPLAESRLCALFTESILYGFYMITYSFTAQHLHFSHYRLKRFDELKIPVVAGTITLFFMITGNLCLGFYRSLRAFVFFPFPNGPQLEYTNVSGWLNVAETSFILVGTIASHWVLIHRCWVIWNRSWRAISISTILWLGCLFCTIRIIILEASFQGKPGVFNSTEILPYGTSFWAASILINISTTFLTIYRIYLIEEANKESGLHPTAQSHEFPQSTIHYIICITVESGLLNTLSAIGTLVTYVIQSNSVYILTAIELPMAGIACNLIILRGNRRTKRLLKLKMKEEGSRSYPLSVPDSIISSFGPATGSTIHRTVDTNPSAPIGHQTCSRGRIEEIPYP